jgi:hypothetical protein
MTNSNLASPLFVSWEHVAEKWVTPETDQFGGQKMVSDSYRFVIISL